MVSTVPNASNTGTAAATGGTPRIFRFPLSWRLGGLLAATILTLVTGIMFLFALLCFPMSWGFGVFMLSLAGFMAALTVYVLRDTNGKWGLRVVLDRDTVTLTLPSGRSLIHRPPAQHLTVPYADIAAIETRLEAYGSLGMECMQRAYVLHRKSGELIFLFEERALATGMASRFFSDIVADLAARADVTLRDLGMVEGRGGFLSVWGTHTPDWATPALPAQRQRLLWARAAMTGSLAVAAASAVPGVWIGGMQQRAPGSEPPPGQTNNNNTRRK